METVTKRFSLEERVIVITGGAGLLGAQHAEAIAEVGGTPVLLDVNRSALDATVHRLKVRKNLSAFGLVCDITKKNEIERCLGKILQQCGRLDGIVNNAANDPKVGEDSSHEQLTRLENLPLDRWNADLAVGITGAFLCAQVLGNYLATHGGGVIVNVASDLSVIAPDQRIYRRRDLSAELQPVKPVTYSVVKSALLGLTRYLATYWAESGVRVNAISPGGVYNGQSEEFVEKLASRIPLGRMATADEYKASLVFLLSDASSYMTGANLIVDGGRSCW